MAEEPKQQNLETLKTGFLAPEQKEVPGIEDFPRSSVVIPRLIIGQPSNSSSLPEGKLINNLTQEPFDALNVVALKFKRSRTLWKPGQPKKGDKPDCRSQDALRADLDYTGRECPRCHQEHDRCVNEKDYPVCEHAKFTKNFRPECRLAYHLLVVTIPSADPFILTVTGKGIAPTNRLMSTFVVKRRSLYSATFKISLEKGDGEFYVIKYSDFKWLEDAEELKGLFEVFKDTTMSPGKEETVVE